jgi:uncharacterized protein YjbI with pentapeptide repeats
MGDIRSAIVAGAADDRPFRPAVPVVNERLDLRAINLGHVDFRGVTFAAFVDFRGAVFGGLAWFDGAAFRSGVDFSGARFDHDARFDRAIFEGEASFTDCEFRGVADFDGAEFRKAAYFDRATCCANLSFGGAKFFDATSLRGAELHGGVWCQQAMFTSLDVTGALLAGRVFVKDAHARLLVDPLRVFGGLVSDL